MSFYLRYFRLLKRKIGFNFQLELKVASVVKSFKLSAIYNHKLFGFCGSVTKK